MKRDELIESFNGRTKNSLQREGIYTVEQLIEKSEIELLHFLHISVISVADIVTTLEKNGFKLKENDSSHYSNRVTKGTVLKLQQEKIRNINSNKTNMQKLFSIFNKSKVRK